MLEEPTFSIIIPTFNYGHYLSTAIESILGQGRPDVEIIVVDDASTDDTAEIVKQYGKAVDCIRLSKNIGPADAWSNGLQKAKGKYICKLDADDWQLPGYMDTVELGFRQDPAIGVVMTSVFIYTEGTESAWVEKLPCHKQLLLNSDQLRKRLLKEFFMRMPGVAVRREIINNHASPMSELFIGHDWEFFLRVFDGYKGLLLEDALAVYRMHEDSVTHAASRDKRVAGDFGFWLQCSRKPSSPYHIPDKDRMVLALSMAKTFLRINGFPKLRMILGKKFLHQLGDAFRLAASERQRLAFSLFFFLLYRLEVYLYHLFVHRPPPQLVHAHNTDLLPGGMLWRSKAVKQN